MKHARPVDDIAFINKLSYCRMPQRGVMKKINIYYISIILSGGGGSFTLYYNKIINL